MINLNKYNDFIAQNLKKERTSKKERKRERERERERESFHAG